MKNLKGKLDWFEKGICVLLMGVLFFTLFCQTLFRNIGVDAVWTDESGRYMFVLLMYMVQRWRCCWASI